MAGHGTPPLKGARHRTYPAQGGENEGKNARNEIYHGLHPNGANEGKNTRNSAPHRVKRLNEGKNTRSYHCSAVT